MWRQEPRAERVRLPKSSATVTRHYTHSISTPSWKKLPGQAGFIEYARHRIANALDGFNDYGCSPNSAGDFVPQPDQRAVGYLATPPSPVNRMVVSNRVGSGKTFSMVLVLDALFTDPRPKIVLVPT